MQHTTMLYDEQASTWSVRQANGPGHYMRRLMGCFAMIENEHPIQPAILHHYQTCDSENILNVQHCASTCVTTMPSRKPKQMDNSASQPCAEGSIESRVSTITSKLNNNAPHNGLVAMPIRVPYTETQDLYNMNGQVSQFANFNIYPSSAGWQLSAQPQAAGNSDAFHPTGFVNPQQLQNDLCEMQRTASSITSSSYTGLQSGSPFLGSSYLSYDGPHSSISTSPAPFASSYDGTSTTWSNVQEANEEPDSEDVKSGDRPYNELLYECLLSAPNHEMQLKDIYQWFRDRTDKGLATKEKAWQNSIRHNLSMNSAFVKGSRSDPDGVKKTMWSLSEDAIHHGRILPTTRYRKNNDRSGYRNRTDGGPALERQKSGALGGQAARRSARLRLRHAVASRNSRHCSAPAATQTAAPHAPTTTGLTLELDTSAPTAWSLNRITPATFSYDLPGSYPPLANYASTGPYYSTNTTPLLANTCLQNPALGFAIDPSLFNTSNHDSILAGVHNLSANPWDSNIGGRRMVFKPNQSQQTAQPQRTTHAAFPSPSPQVEYLPQGLQQTSTLAGRESQNMTAPNSASHHVAGKQRGQNSSGFGANSSQIYNPTSQHDIGGSVTQMNHYGTNLHNHNPQQQPFFEGSFANITLTNFDMQGMNSELFDASTMNHANNDNETNENNANNEWDDFSFGDMDQF